MAGVVMVAQESRFTLQDDGGVAHLFVLGHDALAEPDQLEDLARSGARAQVHYTEVRNAIALHAHAIDRA